MRVVGASSEDEMVLAFLRAEIHSPRFKTVVRRALGGDASLVYRPRLDSQPENQARRNALGLVRGFGLNTYLFRGFPAAVRWVRLAVTSTDIAAMKYARYPTWDALSGGSRLVGDGAANVETVKADEDANANIQAVEREIARGRVYPELIVAATGEQEPHVLVEGHTRATAYVRPRGLPRMPRSR